MTIARISSSLNCSRFGRIAFRQHAAARADLDAVGAVLGDLASLGHQRRHAVRDAVGLVMKLGSEQAFIAVASGDSDRPVPMRRCADPARRRR